MISPSLRHAASRAACWMAKISAYMWSFVYFTFVSRPVGHNLTACMRPALNRPARRRYAVQSSPAEANALRAHGTTPHCGIRLPSPFGSLCHLCVPGTWRYAWTCRNAYADRRRLPAWIPARVLLGGQSVAIRHFCRSPCQ